MPESQDTKLTRRQAQVLELIMSETEKNGYPPSVREIGEKLGLSSSATVHAHLATLEAKGYLHREGAKSRSLTVSGKASDAFHADLVAHGTTEPSPSPSDADQALYGTRHDVIRLPLVGRIAAGSPLLAEQNIEETLSLPREIVGDTSSFLLKVKGESMVDAGILDGDYVVVREQQTADNGDIVAALIGEEATVKVFYREKDCIRLQPCNESMEPIYTDSASIMGIVVALFRTL